MMKMPTFVRNPDKECVIEFGVSGWSTIISVEMEKEFENVAMWLKFLKRHIPKSVGESHPENAEIQWIKIYRLEREWKKS